jgi:hypothetical protein
MRLRILHHANCFDGCASAAVFGRFYEERERVPGSEIQYLGLQHHKGDPFPGDAFDHAEVNACVDFRFSPSSKLHWWFDHHESAFQAPGAREAYEADRSGRKFWDPTAPSNTGFMTRILQERFGWPGEGLEELVRWADIIDSAGFDSAATAVRLEAPALRIMALLESTHDEALVLRMIDALARRPLDEIADAPWVKEPLVPILERHRRSVATVRGLARLDRGVVAIDLSESGLEGANKFIAYDLFPEARYTVVVSRDAKRAKISVGSNPWARETRSHDIAKICERYGGGGHPVVGAVSLDPDQIGDARRVAAEIAATLKDG